MDRKCLLFEPWALGDALIAASALALRPGEFILACQRKWHCILLETVPGIKTTDLLAVETSYERKFNKSGVSCTIDPTFNEYDGLPIYGIRGDLRDYYLARKLFARSDVHMSGWIPFMARKFPLLDIPFRFGILQPKNRYRMWTDLVGIDWSELESFYASAATGRKTTGTVALHVGAQWKSKQFPAVRELASLLEAAGKRVEILAGEGDPLPEGVSASEAKVVMGRELVSALRGCDFVVTNDSGPMHLAALLGVPTVAVACLSNIRCWAPPSVVTVCSERMPKGYAPLPGYFVDRSAEGWPAPAKVLEALTERKLF